MRKVIVASLCILMASGCSKKEETNSGAPVQFLASPAKSPSAEPYLFSAKNGEVYMSWVEQQDEQNLFKFSKLTNGQWSEPLNIASGNTWFVNWADYPMLATDGNENFIAHVLDKSGEGTFSYDVKAIYLG